MLVSFVAGYEFYESFSNCSVSILFVDIFSFHILFFTMLFPSIKLKVTENIFIYMSAYYFWGEAKNRFALMPFILHSVLILVWFELIFLLWTSQKPKSVVGKIKKSNKLLTIVFPQQWIFDSCVSLYFYPVPVCSTCNLSQSPLGYGKNYFKKWQWHSQWHGLLVWMTWPLSWSVAKINLMS